MQILVASLFRVIAANEWEDKVKGIGRNQLWVFMCGVVLLLPTREVELRAQVKSVNAQASYEAGLAAKQKGDYAAAADEFRKALELDKTSIDAVINLAEVTRAMEKPEGPGGGWRPLGPKDLALLKMYEHDNWNKDDPSLDWAYVLTLGLLGIDYPEGGAHGLSQACTLNEAVKPYFVKMAEAEQVPERLLTWEVTFQNCDPKEYKKLQQRILTQFPKDPVAMAVLMDVVDEAETPAERITVLERVRSEFAGLGITAPESAGRKESSDSYDRAMRRLFELYMNADAAKAQALAQEMVKADPGKKNWASYLSVQQLIVQGKTLIADKKFQEASVLLQKCIADKEQARQEARQQAELQLAKADKEEKKKELRFVWDFRGLAPVRRYLSDVPQDTSEAKSQEAQVRVLAAEATAGLGRAAEAYEDLLKSAVVSPVEPFKSALFAIGANLGKSRARVEDELWERRTRNATRFPDFELPTYDGRKVKLSDLRGKVVLLTFWFPT